MYDTRAAVSCKSESCCRAVVLLGYPRLPLRASVYRALMPRVASRQSANPLWLVLSCGHVSWTCSERCVVVKFLSDVVTENTYRFLELCNSAHGCCLCTNTVIDLDTWNRIEVHFGPTVLRVLSIVFFKTLNLGLSASTLCLEISGEIRWHN